MAQQAQLAGTWKGFLEFSGRKMDIIVTFNTENEPWTGSLSSESQQLEDIPISNIKQTGDSLQFGIPLAGGRWKGHIGETLKGHWIQGPLKAPLDFIRQAKPIDLNIRQREQTPVAPFPYQIEEVTYRNPRDAVQLAGTLTIPPGDGPFPAAILHTVAGPNDRDQSHGSPQHKPYRVLADYLTRRGIAVLRADDRGVGGSTGNLFESTIEDFAHDALAGFDLLKKHPKIDPGRIGFIGNSEGTLVGPLAASINPEVAFIITLGGIGIPGHEIILDQVETIGSLAGISTEEKAKMIDNTERLFHLLSQDLEEADLEAKIRKTLEANQSSAATRSLFLLPASIDEQVKIFMSPWYRYQVAYEPGPVLLKLSCPFLALHGDQDPFVNPDKNLEAIGNWLQKGGNQHFKPVKLPNVNHVFQDATNGSPAEYTNNESSFSPRALQLIHQWLAEVLDLN